MSGEQNLTDTPRNVPAPQGAGSRRTVGGVALSTVIGAGVLVSLFIAGVVSYFASEHPDGLEFVAESLGFDHTAEDSAVAGGPLADYGTSGVENEWLSVAIAGTLGLLITGVIAFGLMKLLVRSKK